MFDTLNLYGSLYTDEPAGIVGTKNDLIRLGHLLMKVAGNGQPQEYHAKDSSGKDYSVVIVSETVFNDVEAPEDYHHNQYDPKNGGRLPHFDAEKVIAQRRTKCQ